MSASGGYGPTRVAAGIVGLVDLTMGARAEEVLRAHMAVAGPRFKGIRHAAAWEDRTPEVHNAHTNPGPHLYRDHAKFREGFAALAPLGLSFDAWLYHPQIPDLTALARAFPGQPIVLDHVGGPLGLGWYAGKREEIFAGWKRDIVELAGCANVAIEAFGVQRCMFESNFPVDKITGPYAVYWNAFKRLAAGASASDKAALFRDTPKRFYPLVYSRNRD